MKIRFLGRDRFLPDRHPLLSFGSVAPRGKSVSLGSEMCGYKVVDFDIDHGPVLINGAPEVMLHVVDLQKYFIQEPFVAESGSPSLQLGGISSAELIAPTPDGAFDLAWYSKV